MVALRTLVWVCVLAVVSSPAVLADPPPQSPPGPVTPEATLAKAHLAFLAKKYDHALQLYLQLYLQDRIAQADLRENIRECLRLSAQTRRQRDPAFQQYLLNLPLTSALSLYADALQNLSMHYADRDRATPAKLFVLGLAEFERALSEVTFRQTQLPKVPENKIAQFMADLAERAKATPPDSANAARQALREIVAATQAQLGLKNGSAVVLEFLCGACTGLDEFTLYVQPGTTGAELATPIPELAAYGVLIELKGGQVKVQSVIPQSYAALHTPLRKGDRIIRLNGQDLGKATANNLAAAIRNPGPNGHEVEVVMPVPDMGGSIRLPTPVPSVFGETMLKDDVGYIRLASFREGTLRELETKLQSLQMRGMRALVLDLRGNHGGLFTEAIQVAQRFLPTGVIVSTQGQSPEVNNRVFSSDSGMSALNLPLVVLVDTRTMSSAEVLAGALRYQNRATLVGMPTFGKGALQGRVRLLPAETTAAPSPGGTLILTIGKAIAPNGRAIEGAGIMPHLVEPETSKQLEVAMNRAMEMIGMPMLPMPIMPEVMIPEKP